MEPAASGVKGSLDLEWYKEGVGRRWGGPNSEMKREEYSLAKTPREGGDPQGEGQQARTRECLVEGQ